MKTVEKENVSGFSTMSSAIEFADNYNNWIITIFRPYIKETILEIGTGQGNFRRYLPTVSTYVSVDIDAQVVERASQRDPGGTYIQADIADKGCLGKLSAFRFDTVLCTNVLEHIEDDRAAVTNMLNVLVDGGHLLLFVPAFQSLYSTMDRLAGHHRRYTRSSLRTLFQGLPGNFVALDYFNPVGGVGWWVNKFLKHENLDSSAINSQIAFFDRYVLPMSRLINPLTRGFFGQSIICIVRKSSIEGK